MQFIKLDLSNAIAPIKLQHAGGNRINFQMREEIFNAVESVAKSDARVLVIKGDGEDFCLGGDVRDWPDVPVDKLRPRVEVFANAQLPLRLRDRQHVRRASDWRKQHLA
jgi:enoyl-CoA hydratase/carnithine racemase